MKNLVITLVSGLGAASCSTLNLGGAADAPEVVAESNAVESSPKTLESGEKILTAR